VIECNSRLPALDLWRPTAAPRSPAPRSPAPSSSAPPSPASVLAGVGTSLLGASLLGASLARRPLARRLLARRHLARRRGTSLGGASLGGASPRVTTRQSRQPPRMGRHHVCRMAVQARRPSVARMSGRTHSTAGPGILCRGSRGYVMCYSCCILLFLSLFRVRNVRNSRNSSSYSQYVRVQE